MDFLLGENNLWNLWILLIALASGAMLLWPNLGLGRSVPRLAVADAVQQFNRDQGLFVDIRPAEQFKSGHIPQARNITLDTLEAHLGTLPQDKPIVLVDARGRESARAVAQLRKHGFKQVSCLDGGVAAWADGGMPLKKS